MHDPADFAGQHALAIWRVFLPCARVLITKYASGAARPCKRCIPAIGRCRGSTPTLYRVFECSHIDLIDCAIQVWAQSLHAS